MRAEPVAGAEATLGGAVEHNFTHLDWDSDFFGLRIARIMVGAPDADQLSATLNHLRENGYRLAYWFLPDSQPAADLAQAHGGLLADQKVTYLKELPGAGGAPPQADHRAASYPRDTPDDALIALALQSGENSRFRLDPGFSREQFESLYTCWITRSVSRELAWEVLVVTGEQELLGVVTLGSKGERGDIGLLAVSGQARGKGIGRTLVLEADRLFAQRGFRWAQVVTQLRNTGACRLYESCGYQVEKIEQIYHFWL